MILAFYPVRLLVVQMLRLIETGDRRSNGLDADVLKLGSSFFK